MNARKPNPSDHPLVAACRRLMVAMERFEEGAAGALGVGRNDLRALNLLERGPLPAGALAGLLGLTTGSVTTLLDRLERAGLVRRRHDETDRRRILVDLQPATWAAFAGVYAPLGLAVGALADDLPPAELAAVVRLMSRVTEEFDNQRQTLADRDQEAR